MARILEILAIAALVLVAILLAARKVEDPDLPWHLSAGNRILAERQVPEHDSLALLSRGRRWINAAWLGDVAMALLYRGGGFVLLQAGTIAITLVALALLFVAAPRPHRLGAVSPLALLALLASVQRLAPRPDLVSILFPGLAVLLVLRLSDPALAPLRRRGFLIALGALQILWSNLHGSLVLGPAIAGAALAGSFLSPPAHRSRRALAAALLITAAATLVNPWGPGIFPLYKPYLSAIAGRLGLVAAVSAPPILEWTPTLSAAAVDADLMGLKPYYTLLILAALAALLAIRARRPIPAAILLLFAAASTTAMRQIAAFAFITALLAPRLFEEWATRWRPATSRRASVLLAAATLAASTGLVWAVATNRFYADRHNLGETGPGLRPDTFPAGAAAWVEATAITGQGFHNYTAGGYWTWRFAGSRLALADGRLDVLDPAALDRLNQAMTDPAAFEAMATEHGVSHVVLDYSTEAWPLIRYLLAARGWRRAFADTAGVVFVAGGTAVPAAAVAAGARAADLVHPWDRAASGAFAAITRRQIHVPQGRLDLALVHELSGEYRAALDQYRAALDHMPDLSRAHLHSAALYIELGEIAAARGHVRWIATHEPDHPHLAQLRAATGE